MRAFAVFCLVPPLPPSCIITGLFLALVEDVEDVEDVWRINFGSIGENGLWRMMEDVEDNFDISGSAFLKMWILHSKIRVFSFQNRWFFIL
jgi:hypothetical protein